MAPRRESIALLMLDDGESSNTKLDARGDRNVMDNRIRRNEVCIVGLPRCDFVFSSTRTCFIAYGFQNSPLEVSVLRRLLEDRGIQAEEAGGSIAPGQNVFCAKICSKIIMAQFCIVLINNLDCCVLGRSR
jgi:hypothetical protein